MTPLDEARSILAGARRLVVFTGAGVSADSGVPTFRGASSDALWGKYNSAQLASPQGFAADPIMVYSWYAWRRSQLVQVQPNAAHVAIARLQERGAVIITQNVDGLHERVAPAGTAILRLHGTLLEDRCYRCDYRESVDLDRFSVHSRIGPQDPGLVPPRCPQCASHLRPAVVWFGENLDAEVWSAAERACRQADAMLVVGTSGEVYPAASLVELVAREAPVVLANLDPGPLDYLAAVTLEGRAAEIVPKLL